MGTQQGSVGDRPATSERRTVKVALLGAALMALLSFAAGLQLAGPLKATFSAPRAPLSTAPDTQPEPLPLADRVLPDTEATAVAEAWDQVSVLSGTVVDGNGQPVAGAELDLVGDPLDASLRAVGTAQATIVPHQTLGWRAPPTDRDDNLGVTIGSVPAIPQAIPMRASVLFDTKRSSIVSDIHGRFTIDDVLPGTVRVRASGTGWADGQTDPFLVRPASSRSGIRLTLSRGATVSGRVLGPDGVPLAMTPLHVQCSGQRQALTTITDPQGRFEMSGAAGSCFLVVRPEHLPAIQRRFDAVEGKVLALEMRATTEFTTARGTVADDLDRPVSGATVEFTPLDPSFGEPRATISDSRGWFEVSGLAAQPHRVTVDHPDFTPLELANVVVLDPLALTVARGILVTGTLTFRDDAHPVSGARVTLTTPAGIKRAARTDALGRFEFRRVSDGFYTIISSHEEALEGSTTLSISPADTDRGVADVGNIDLVRAGAVSGMVLDRLGVPVPLARVTAGTARAITDGAGAFRLTGLPKGDVSVHATHPVAGTARQPTLARVYEGQETPGLRVHLTGRYDPGGGPSTRLATEPEIDSPPTSPSRAVTSTGIAVELGSRNGAVVVLSVQAGSTAETAGVRVGDIVRTVDGETVSVAGQARSLVRGPVDTVVTLEIVRGRRTQRVMIRRERYATPAP